MNKNLIVLSFIFLLSLASVYAITTVPTFNTYNIKWIMCDQFNLTRWDCDAWWESDQNPYYVEPNSDGLNLSTVKKHFYNKTDVDNILKNYYNESEVISLVLSNEINSSVLDGYYNKTQIDEIRQSIMVNFSDRFATTDDLEDLEEGDSSTGGVNDSTLLIIFGLIIVGVIGFFIYTQMNKNKPDYNGNYGTPGVQRIQSRKKIDPEEELRKLKAELDKKEKIEENKE